MAPKYISEKRNTVDDTLNGVQDVFPYTFTNLAVFVNTCVDLFTVVMFINLGMIATK